MEGSTGKKISALLYLIVLLHFLLATPFVSAAALDDRLYIKDAEVSEEQQTRSRCVRSRGNDVYAFRLHPGVDLLNSILEFQKTYNIEAGYVVTCVGSLTQAAIRMANANSTTILKDSHFEIVSLVGTLAVNGAHLHISISDPHGKTIGGHLMEGSLIYTTAEIVLGDATQLKFVREIDPGTTYDELVVECRE